MQGSIPEQDLHYFLNHCDEDLAVGYEDLDLMIQQLYKLGFSARAIVGALFCVSSEDDEAQFASEYVEAQWVLCKSSHPHLRGKENRMKGCFTALVRPPWVRSPFLHRPVKAAVEWYLEQEFGKCAREIQGAVALATVRNGGVPLQPLHNLHTLEGFIGVWRTNRVPLQLQVPTGHREMFAQALVYISSHLQR